MQDTLEGGCMCGMVRFKVSPPYKGIISCHCKQCQRFHGNYNPLLIAEKKNFSFTSGEDNVQWFNSSPESERGFCKTCGSQMFKRDKTGPKMKMSVGCLDDTSGLTTVKNVGLESKGDYYVTPPENKN